MKRHLDGVTRKFFVIESKQQERRRPGAGHGDGLAAQSRCGTPGPGNEQRAATPPEGSAGPQEHVAVTKPAQGVKGDLRDIQSPVEREAVQGLDILQPLPETQAAGFDPARDEGVKNKRVVGAGRKTEGQEGGCFHLRFRLSTKRPDPRVPG